MTPILHRRPSTRKQRRLLVNLRRLAPHDELLVAAEVTAERVKLAWLAAPPGTAERAALDDRAAEAYAHVREVRRERDRVASQLIYAAAALHWDLRHAAAAGRPMRRSTSRSRSRRPRRQRSLRCASRGGDSGDDPSPPDPAGPRAGAAS
jgi:hypothetical protein